MKTNSLKTTRTIWLGVAVSVALLLLASPRTAQAQQWTGPDGSNNISNANTANVGVGLTVPLYKFDVLSGTNIIARFGSSASAHSQLLINAASGYNANLTFQNGGLGKWYLGNRATNDRFSFIGAGGSIEVFSILQDGSVGVGTTTPGSGLNGVDTKLHIVGAGGGLDTSLAIETSSDTITANPSLYTFRSRGTAGSKTIVASGDTISQITAYAHDGSTYLQGARIDFMTDGTPGLNDMPTRITFATTADGASSTTERLRITNGGNVGIGTTNPLSNLQIGTQAQTATATPVTLSLGGTYSNTANANFKLKLYDDGTNTYGLGVSSNSMDFGVYPTAGYNWYAGTALKMTLNNSGHLYAAGLCLNSVCKTDWSQVGGGGSSQWTGTGPIYYTGGNVGIGLSTFQANGLLQVNGSIGLSGARQIRPASNADTDTLQFLGTKLTIGTLNSHAYGYAGTGLIASVSSSGNALLLDAGGNNAATAHRLKITNDGTGVTGNLFYGTPTVTALYANSANGNVGIGTTSPGYPLHVKRDQNSDAPGLTVENASTGTAAAASFAVRNSTSAADALILDAVGSSFSSTGGFIQDAGAISAEAGLLGGLSIMTRANAPIRFYTNGHTNERMRIDSNGNVGIGTTPNASYKLDVAGTVNATSILVNGSPISGGGGGTITGVTAGAGLTGGGTSGAVTLNIGAGTGVTVATDSVSVNYGSGSGTAVEGNKSLTITTDGSSGLSGGASVTLGAGGTVTLTNADKGSGQNIFKNVANASGTNQFSATVNNDAIRFAGSGGTTVTFDGANKKVTIDGSTSNIAAANVTAGQFGAGNYTFPGNVTVTGTINAKYQDVAEWVPSSEQIFAGTVVVLDTTKSNQVIASTQSYDTRVAGVISAQPGITLGEAGEGKVLVATTGRVLVQVDASKGAIHIGDLLVTSDVAGVAMKSTPVNLSGIQLHRPGTIIGKALEPLEKGAGKILVLLSLQ